MDLDTLRNLVEISRLRNITEASKVLHVSQSAISVMLKNVETELGNKLFVRGSKGMYMNENGQLLTAAAQRVLAQYEATLETLRLSECSEGTIHFGVQVENDGLIDLIATLRNVYPRISYRMFSMKASLNDYLNSDLDFYVLPEAMLGDLPHLSIAVNQSLYAIMSRKHPLAQRQLLRLEDLKKERFAFTMRQDGSVNKTYHYCLEAGFQPEVAFLCDDITTQMELVRQTDTVMITYNAFRRFRNDLNELVEIPVDFTPSCETIYLAWSHQPNNPLVGHIVEYLLERYPNGFRRSKAV